MQCACACRAGVTARRTQEKRVGFFWDMQDLLQAGNTSESTSRSQQDFSIAVWWPRDCEDAALGSLGLQLLPPPSHTTACNRAAETQQPTARAARADPWSSGGLGGGFFQFLTHSGTIQSCTTLLILSFLHVQSLCLISGRTEITKLLPASGRKPFALVPRSQPTPACCGLEVTA